MLAVSGTSTTNGLPRLDLDLLGRRRPLSLLFNYLLNALDEARYRFALCTDSQTHGSSHREIGAKPPLLLLHMSGQYKASLNMAWLL